MHMVTRAIQNEKNGCSSEATAIANILGVLTEMKLCVHVCVWGGCTCMWMFVHVFACTLVRNSFKHPITSF